MATTTIEATNTTKPMTSTEMVRAPHPFHSFNKIPHTLLNVTFNDIRILHEKASRTGLSVRKLFPISRPKNCEYHKTPAKAQNNRLFTKILLFTEK